jgi:hypothetical protein
VFGLPIEALKYRRQIRDDVPEGDEFRVQLGLTTRAVPDEPIELALAASTLDYQAHRPSRTLRGVRDLGRKQKDLALTNRQVGKLPFIGYFQNDIAFDLIEKFFTFVDVVVGARIGTADDSDHELAVLPDLLVPDRGLEEVPMLVDPFPEIERL